MLKFKLSDAIIEDSRGFPSKHYTSGDWIMIYEWLCREFLKSGSSDYEALNATSSINNFGFNEIYDLKAACHRIAYMLTHELTHSIGSSSWELHKFLQYLGIGNWSDLDKTITIIGRRPKIFPQQSWFNLEGRTFNYSPNNCHPNAKCVQNFSIQFSRYTKLWDAKIYYSYPHDGSSWNIFLDQKRNEHLDTFAKRIDEWLAKVLIPEKDDRHRIYENENWHRIKNAWKELFYEDDMYNVEKEIADMLVKKQGVGIRDFHIVLNKQRLTTIKKWIK